MAASVSAVVTTSVARFGVAVTVRPRNRGLLFEESLLGSVGGGYLVLVGGGSATAVVLAVIVLTVIAVPVALAVVVVRHDGYLYAV